MRFHHIGKVVKDLHTARASYEQLLGLKVMGEPVLDPLQKVVVQFLSDGEGTGPLIELISPVSEDSPVSKFLERKEGLHHLCFEVKDIHKEIENLRKKGALVLGSPSPGSGHENRMTAWIYTPDKELLELVEK